MLTDDHVRDFVRDGYLVLGDGIDDDLISEARERIWDAVPEDPDDPESLLGIGSRLPDVPADEPFATVKRQLYEYGRELVGDELEAPEGPGMQLALRYPTDLRLSAHHDRRPDFGHLDGFGPGFRDTGEYSGFSVAAVVYFDRVPERGGGFTVWPGSHWVAADYFEDHSLESPGYHGRLPAIADGERGPDWDYEGWFHEQARSQEIPGEAGTVILWHNKLLHSAGVNQSRRVRMAGIERFRREDYDDIKEQAATRPFAYWEGVDSGLVEDVRDR